MNRYISPSILAADFNRLGEEISIINRSNAGWIHCDVMNGAFVPNISFGIPVLESVKRVAEKPLDVHLMIQNPELFIDTFCRLGADILTIHQEAVKHLHRAIFQIKEQGVKAGVSLNPSTPIGVLSEVIHEIDLVLVMSVNPGFGGQSFIEQSYSKIKQLKKLIEESGSHALIQVDGGVTLDNARQLFDAGVNILVAGTTVFKSENPVEMIDKMLQV
jgi:ribulose-phosphate 3-epimerase